MSMFGLGDYLPTWLGGIPATEASTGAGLTAAVTGDKTSAIGKEAIGKSTITISPTELLAKFKKLLLEDKPNEKECAEFSPLGEEFYKLLNESSERDTLLRMFGSKAPLFEPNLHRKIMLYGTCAPKDKTTSGPFDSPSKIVAAIWTKCAEGKKPFECEINGQRPYLNVLRIYVDYFTAMFKWDNERKKLIDTTKTTTRMEANNAWVKTLLSHSSFQDLFRSQLWQRIWLVNTPTQNDRFEILGFIALLITLPKEVIIEKGYLSNSERTVQPGLDFLRASFDVWSKDIVETKKTVDKPKVAYLHASLATTLLLLLEIFKEDGLLTAEKAEAIKAGKMPYYFSYDKSQAGTDIASLFSLELLQNESFIAVMKENPAKETFFEILVLNPAIPAPTMKSEKVTKDMSPIDSWKAIYS